MRMGEIGDASVWGASRGLRSEVRDKRDGRRPLGRPFGSREWFLWLNAEGVFPGTRQGVARHTDLAASRKRGRPDVAPRRGGALFDMVKRFVI